MSDPVATNNGKPVIRTSREDLMDQIRCRLDTMQARIGLTVATEVPFAGMDDNLVYDYLAGLDTEMQECRALFMQLT